MPDQGEVVLIPIPLTDLSSQKRRPVIVIKTFGRINTTVLNQIRNKLQELISKK